MTTAPPLRAAPGRDATTAQRPRRRRRVARRWFWPYVFVAPFLLVFTAFGAYPMLFALQLSFTNWRGSGVAEWVGLSNYTFLLTNAEFWNSLFNSAVLWLLIVPAQLAIALLAAIGLNNAMIRMRGFYRTVYVVPFVTPLVAMAQVWIILFDQDFGAVNALLGLVGLPDVAWLTSTFWSKPTLALLFIWKTTGFAIIILLSGLQSIPNEVYEAAELDGVTPRRRIWSITLPLIRRTVVFLMVIQTIAVFQMFAEPFVMTRGGPQDSSTTAGLYLYSFIGVSDFGTGAAGTFLLVVIVMAMSLLFLRLLRPKD